MQYYHLCISEPCGALEHFASTSGRVFFQFSGTEYSFVLSRAYPSYDGVYTLSSLVSDKALYSAVKTFLFSAFGLIPSRYMIHKPFGVATIGSLAIK